ncbi:MAG: NAD(P)H-dependent oxidoreductase [Pseudomonadota bacterium]
MSDKIVLAFAASNNTNSINAKLAQHAARILKVDLAANVTIYSLDLNDYEMPIYSPQRQEAEGIPPLAQAFFDKLGAADALIISFAEYNGSYTSAFKNIFDWCSRIDMKIYQDKPMLALATSIGGRGGQNVLQTVLTAGPFFGADIKASFSFGPFSEHFDADAGHLTTPDLAQQLSDAVAKLKEAIES